MAEALRGGSPGTSDSVFAVSSDCTAFNELAELTGPTGMSAYFEMAFHTFGPDVECLKSVNDPAARIANGDDSVFGL